MASQAKSGAFKRYFEEHRTLDAYPTGAYRWWLLILAVMATMVSYYEFGFPALLPLWLPALHFSAQAFGYFLTFAVIVSAGSAMIGGPLADRHGRVVVVDVCLALIIVLTFCNLLMTGFWSFVLVRGLMNAVAGLMWGALGGLTRDFSPRLSRGAAFGLLTAGAVLCQLLWNQIPALTLPIFHTWQSQIWIMSFLAVALYIPVLLWLKDLSPQLRSMVIGSEEVAEAFESGDIPAAEMPLTESSFGLLLSQWQTWVMVVGVVGFLGVAITIQSFGPLMFVEHYHYAPGAAARMTALFWWLNLLMLVPSGWISDYLQVRKPISILLGILTLAILLFWVLNFHSTMSSGKLGTVTFVLGGAGAFAFIPWCALYSEYLEDLSPSLQATGWSFFQFVNRIYIALSGPVILIVAHRYGWGTWMWVPLTGTALFIVSLLVLPGRWRPPVTSAVTVRAAPVPAGGR
jgi:OPA family glycerol-3-phosphate transporter-like MFS transporter